MSHSANAVTANIAIAATDKRKSKDLLHESDIVSLRKCVDLQQWRHGIVRSWPLPSSYSFSLLGLRDGMAAVQNAFHHYWWKRTEAKKNTW